MLDGAQLAHEHPAELLGRPELGEQPAEAARRLAGRRVLVTGAGGSVGRHLATALAGAGLETLALLDHHEASLYELHRRFGAEPGVSLILADVRNSSRLADVVGQTRPELIFHLAAYKHVPFGEVFSDETFAVNVLGTARLLELADAAGVERFVYPSSDKACDPPSLYGATKRLGELLVRLAARRTGRPFNVARFVNILGTQGSVIETFAQQVQGGGPLTVTDAAMTRYWIGMSEAVWLLLSTAELAAGGKTLMLDARAEISVVEMARRVCHLLGPAADACEIVYGTPRPGERLHEQLLAANETFQPAQQAGLLRVVDQNAAQNLERATALLAGLEDLGASGDAAAIRSAAMQAAAELQ